MKSICIRSAAAFVGALLATLGIFNIAQAQNDYPPYLPTNPVFQPDNDLALGAPALPYDGPFSVTQPQVSNGPLGFAGVNVQSSTATQESSEGGTGGGLAVTGADVELPFAVGAALLASGGTAIVAARKRDELDH